MKAQQIMGSQYREQPEWL